MTHTSIERLTPPQRHRLDQAKTHAFETWKHLDRFAEHNDLWHLLPDEFPHTGPALNQRLQSVKVLSSEMRRIWEKVIREIEGIDTAWRAHQDFLATFPRSQQVSTDRNIGKAMAALFEAGKVDDVTDMIDLLGLGPDGPEGARWELEVRHHILYWTPIDWAEPDDEHEDWPDDDAEHEPNLAGEYTGDPWAETVPAAPEPVPGPAQAPAVAEATPHDGAETTTVGGQALEVALAPAAEAGAESAAAKEPQQ